MTKRTIRLATEQDLPRIQELIDQGRQKMREIGNTDQWTNGYPQPEVLLGDIRAGNSYLLFEGDVAIATYAFVKGPDVTYARIYEGQWLDDGEEYYVIHRMASAPGVHGVVSDVLDDCFRRTSNIRIDTHRHNTAMQGALKKCGFQYCGIIYLLDGAERLAFQRRL